PLCLIHSSSALRLRHSRDWNKLRESYRVPPKGQIARGGWKKAVVADEKSIGSFAHETCEGRIDLAAGAGVENLDLESQGASSRLHISQRDLCIRGIGWVDEHSNTSG